MKSGNVIIAGLHASPGRGDVQPVILEHVALILEFDVYFLAVEYLVYSLISPSEDLLIEVEHIDRKECSRCNYADLYDGSADFAGLAYRAILLVCHSLLLSVCPQDYFAWPF